MIRVHILATCRKPELLPFTTLVFSTVRVGFPTAEITVHLNRLSGEELAVIDSCCRVVGAATHSVDTIHHAWINELLRDNYHPFFILDTDVIFYESFEQFLPEFKYSALAGCRTPEWRDDFSKAVTRARLHTSLLYFTPSLVEQQLMAYRDPRQDTEFTPRANVIDPLVVPFKRQAYFYDTCSLLYHAIGGYPFTDAQKNAYFHFHFGTISDVVLPCINEAERKIMAEKRVAVMANPVLGRGAWREQEEYFACKQA